MKVYKEVLKKVVDYTICDFCKQKSEIDIFQGATDVRIAFGYGSDFDTSVFDFDVCDNCFKLHFDAVLKNIKPKFYL